MIKRIKVWFLKCTLRLLGLIFNKTNDIESKLLELEAMKKEGRLILNEDLNYRIFNDISIKEGSEPTKEHFLFVQNKVNLIFKKTGYYPSKKQMDYFISEYKE